MEDTLPQSASSMPADPSDTFEAKLQKLRFYRDEIRHEFNLLSNRVSAHITSQSFLVTAFALSMGNLNPRWGDLFRMVFPLSLALLGIGSSILVWPGIKGACDTIDLWHQKQQRLYVNDPQMEAFRVERPGVLSGKGDPVDLIHQRSLLFARWSPWVFTIAWSVFGLLALLLHFRGRA